MTESICLVIIFNHRYDDNIPKLRTIYGDRFSKMRFLVPFYNGNDPEVIPVFECSYQFEGFLIQAFDKLIKVGADYYFFIADDLILNPAFDENNILSCMRGKNKKALITSIQMLNSEGMFAWSHSRYSSKPFRHKATQWKQSLVDYDVAMLKFAEFFGSAYPEKYIDAFFKPHVGESHEHFMESIEQFKKSNNGTLDIPYPLARGYSDIFVLNKDVLYEVSYTCGIFSSMNLFVEIGLPTALVLNIQKEHITLLGENENYRCQAMWTVEEVEQFANEAEYSYKKLLEIWDDKCGFVHPVKLSQWDV